MSIDNFNLNVLIFPDKEKAEPTADNAFVETDKAGKKKYYVYDAKLRVRIRWNANVLNFNLGERVELAKWSTEAQRCKRGTTHGKKKRHANDINLKIESMLNNIDAIFQEFTSKNIIPTVEQLRSRYNNQSPEAEKEKAFADFYNEFVNKESSQNNWKATTTRKMLGALVHLCSFGEAVKKFDFDYFNKEGLNAYVSYLRDKKGMQNGTIKKQLSILKWFLKWARNEGYNKNDAFLTFAPKMPTAEKKVIFLDWSELMTVYKFDFASVPTLETDSVKALERVRDVFCFCCFTSLRYSDAENLRRTDIKGDELHITTIKTDDKLTIDLNDYSKAILLKYADEVYPNNKALPVISNQKMNDHLKQMGEICGLDTPLTLTYYKGAKRFDEVYPKYELLTTHCGRRTFICNALMLGIAPTTVMKWTGHSDYKSMKPYIDVADAEKKNAMKLFNR